MNRKPIQKSPKPVASAISATARKLSTDKRPKDVAATSEEAQAHATRAIEKVTADEPFKTRWYGHPDALRRDSDEICDGVVYQDLHNNSLAIRLLLTTAVTLRGIDEFLDRIEAEGFARVPFLRDQRRAMLLAHTSGDRDTWERCAELLRMNIREVAIVEKVSPIVKENTAYLSRQKKAAKKDRAKPEVTGRVIASFVDAFTEKYKSARGAIEAAINHFGLKSTTLRRRLKEFRAEQ